MVVACLGRVGLGCMSCWALLPGLPQAALGLPTLAFSLARHQDPCTAVLGAAPAFPAPPSQLALPASSARSAAMSAARGLPARRPQRTTAGNLTKAAYGSDFGFGATNGFPGAAAWETNEDLVRVRVGRVGGLLGAERAP